MSDDRTRVGVVVMAYGTPASVDDIEPYYTHIRRGRPPEPHQLADLVARYVLTQPDGGSAVVVISRSEASLDKAIRLITTSELLPGEDPALLPGPSRVERYRVTDVRPGAGAR